MSSIAFHMVLLRRAERKHSSARHAPCTRGVQTSKRGKQPLRAPHLALACVSLVQNSCFIGNAGLTRARRAVPAAPLIGGRGGGGIFPERVLAGGGGRGGGSWGAEEVQAPSSSAGAQADAPTSPGHSTEVVATPLGSVGACCKRGEIRAGMRW